MAVCSTIDPSLAKNPGFDCTRCGECCRGDQEIYLNLDDLELLRAFLGLGTALELYRLGLVAQQADRSGQIRPLIRFAGHPVPSCPFLENRLDLSGKDPRAWARSLEGLCRLHPDFKPLVCRLSPLARYVEAVGTTLEETWYFVPPVQDCPGVGKGPLPYQTILDQLRIRLDREAEWIQSGLKLPQGLPGQKDTGNPGPI